MKINTLSILMLFCAIALIGISGSEAFGQTNLALTANNPKVTAKQSSVNEWKEANLKGTAEHAVDGDVSGSGLGKIAETLYGQKDSWFEVDLGDLYKIDKIIIHPRTDCCQDVFKSAYIIVADQAIGDAPMVDDARIAASSTFSRFNEPIYEPGNKARTIPVNGSVGRYVRVQIKGEGAIQLAEIEIFGEPKPAAGYKPDTGKAWDAAIKVAFDPSKPYFLGTDRAKNPAYWGTLQGSPKIVVAKNSPTSFDVAYQDLYGTGKKIRINTYEKNGAGFKKNVAASTEADGFGTFAGFTKDASKNRYVFTGENWTDYEQLIKAQVVKIPAQGSPEVIWDAQYFEPGKDSITPGVKSFMNGFYEGTSRLVAANNSLLITTNIFPTHPYQVILNTQDKSKNTSRAFFESMNQHNFGQRAIFDGSDFVIMENRDHDVSVTLSKINPAEKFPLQPKNISDEDLAKQNKPYMHSGEYIKRIFSVYSHTNFGNNTYTELGNVEKGFGDNGYLVLFSGERDWNYKMTGYNFNSDKRAPNILSPRDLGLVHVKKDFDKQTANWVDKDGKSSMCPAKVDTSNVVNSAGEKTTVNYRASEDGWDWAGSYNPEGPCKNTLGSDRILETKGVKWVTNYGSTYAASKKKADADQEFTSVNHPKLVRIAQNNYIAVWEEWKAKVGEPLLKYVTTKAALITLKAAANGEVNIELTSDPKDLGNYRLMPGDDAFEFDGKAAWATGDAAKGKLMFYTVDAALKLDSYELEL